MASSPYGLHSFPLKISKPRLEDILSDESGIIEKSTHPVAVEISLQYLHQAYDIFVLD